MCHVLRVGLPGPGDLPAWDSGLPPCFLPAHSEGKGRDKFWVLHVRGQALLMQGGDFASSDSKPSRDPEEKAEPLPSVLTRVTVDVGHVPPGPGGVRTLPTR